VASLSQGRTAAAQCGLFTHKSVPVIFEPPCIKGTVNVQYKVNITDKVNVKDNVNNMDDVNIKNNVKHNRSKYILCEWPISVAALSKAWICGCRLLESWVRFPPESVEFFSCECCVLSDRGLCDGLITSLQQSYRLWCV